MSNKKYRLLGREKTNPEWCVIFPFMLGRDFTDKQYGFEEVKEEKITVTEFYFECHTGNGRDYVLSTNLPIPEEKFPEIKKVVEFVLNDKPKDELVFAAPNRKYTQLEVDKIMEDAFNAGRELATPYFGSGFFYKNFNAYKNHKS